MYHSVDLNHYQTQTQSLKLSFTDFDSGHEELFVFYHWKLLKGSRACVASVSVWFRGKKRQWKILVLTAREMKWEPKNERGEKGEGKKGFLLLSSPLPPRSFACAIFRAVFDSCSSFFASKPHSNACYSGYLVGNSGGRVGATPDNGKLIFPTMAKSCTWV